MPISLAELDQLQQKKNELGNEIRSLAENQENWTAEDEAKFDELNTLYDSNESVMDAERRAIKVQSRVEHIAEREARSEDVWQGRTTLDRMLIREHDKATNGVTFETRMMALQGFLRLNNGMAVQARHEDAFKQLSFNPLQREFELRMTKTPFRVGHEAWACCGGLMPSKALKELDQRWGTDGAETRDLTTGPAPDAGATVPIGFQRELTRAMLAFGGPRQVCRIFSTDGWGEFQWPTANDTANAATIVDEAADVGGSVDPGFAQIVFRSAKYRSLIVCSQELLEDSAFNMAMEFASMLGTRIGRGTSADFTNGTGVVGGTPNVIPQGLVTAAVDSGVTLPAAGAEPTDGDFLIDLMHSVDPSYRALPSFGWMFNDGTLAIIRKLKTTTAEYTVWQQGLIGMQPDMILGKPYTINQSCPAWAANTTGAILVGAFETHVIRDVSGFRFQRLEELYRANDQTGFLVFSRHDSRALNGANTDNFLNDPIKTTVQPI